MNPPSLKSFFFFNPTLSVKEGTEHEKILFFHPHQMNLGEKTNSVGLSEGLITFTRTFSPDGLCEAVRREKHTCAFYNPEPNFWVVMIVKNPFIIKTAKDGKATYQYFEDEVDDALLQSIIRQSYKMFRLFNGPCQKVMDEVNVQDLRKRLENFVPAFISTLNFEQLDLFTTLEGIQFLPVDKNVYLRIQSFVNLTEDTFPKILYSAFLFRDHLVWSGLEQDDMRAMYSYLTSPLALSEGAPGRADNGSPVRIRGRTGFVTGPEDLTKDKSPINAPRVYVGNKQYHLIVYELQDILSIFLVDQSVLNDIALYQQLDSFISPHINFLSPILAENYSRKHGEDQYRYVYFNHMNLAMKTSLKQRGADLPKETMKMLNEMHADFEKQQPSLPSEVLIRTSADRWLVGRKSDQREFYVFFDSKNANLLEINEEVKKLTSTYFNTIFID